MTLENAIVCVEGYSLHHKCSDTYVFWDLTSEDSLTQLTLLVAIIKDGDLYIKDFYKDVFELLLKKDCVVIGKDLHVRGEI